MLEEKDAPVEQEQSLEEILVDAEKEVDGEPSEESSTPEEAPQEKDEETTTLEGLDDDEDFQAAKKELQEEMGGKDLSFTQTKKFRKTYWQAKENERQLTAKQEELETLQNKQLSDNEILGEGVKRGLFEQDKKPVTEKEKFDYDALYSKATPEQQEWLTIIKNVADQNKQAVETELSQYKEQFGKLEQSRVESNISNEENEVREELKAEGIDYDKDIYPDIAKIIPGLQAKIRPGMTLSEAGWTPRLLANQVIAGKRVELAKKELARERQELNKDKKKANIETDSVQGVTEPPNDTNASIEEIMKDEMVKEGLAKFE